MRVLLVISAVIALGVAQSPRARLTANAADGRYYPSDDGQYRPDNSGAYNGGSDGSYHPDNSGAYVGDNSGNYRGDYERYVHTADQFGGSGGSGGGGGGSGGSGGAGAGGAFIGAGIRRPATAVLVAVQPVRTTGTITGSRVDTFSGSRVGTLTGTRVSSVTGSRVHSGSGLAVGAAYGSTSGGLTGSISSARVGTVTGSRVSSGSGAALGAGFGSTSGVDTYRVTQGSGSGLYDNRNYAIIRKEAQVGEDGYHYLYETENKILGEEQGKLANVGSDDEALQASGYYEYTGPDNVVYRVDYTANENGFVPSAAHIPQPPPIPEAIVRSLEYLRSIGKL